MQIETKKLVASMAVLVLVSFASGRYLVPEKIKIEKQIVTVEKKTEDKKIADTTNIHKDKTYTKTSTTKKNKDGSSVTTTTTTVQDKTKSDHDSISSDRDTSVASSSNTQTKEVTTSSSKVNFGLMTGPDLSHGLNMNTIVYGGYFNRPILGPITMGVWGLSNSTYGVSMGLTF